MAYQWCSFCGANTHTVDNCPKTWGGQGNRNAMRCSYCGKTDHRNSSCPSLGREGRVAGDFIQDR